MDPEPPVPALGHHATLSELPDEAIDAFVGTVGPETDSPLLLAEVRHLGGALQRPADEGGALDAAVELANVIADNGPLAVAATKQVARTTQDWSFAEGWRQQGAIVTPVFTSEDAREGATAFAEKRKPVWKGR